MPYLHSLDREARKGALSVRRTWYVGTLIPRSCLRNPLRCSPARAVILKVVSDHPALPIHLRVPYLRGVVFRHDCTSLWTLLCSHFSPMLVPLHRTSEDTLRCPSTFLSGIMRGSKQVNLSPSLLAHSLSISLSASFFLLPLPSQETLCTPLGSLI